MNRGSKAVCANRLLRFEALEGRLLMSADPTLATSASTLINPILTVQGPSTPSAPPLFTSITQTITQPDGKTLVAGVENGGFEIARYNSDGTLDMSFGTDGVTTFGKLNLMVVQQIKLASDGSIYLVGEAAVSGTMADQISGPGGSWWTSPDEVTSLIHVGADGSVDTTYGNNGVLSLNDPLTLPMATIQNDGKIVVASENSLSTYDDVAVVNRYNADGTLDTSFQYQPGELPYVGIDPGGPIMVDAQGRIVLSGESANGFNLMRLNSDGTVDTTFGTSGVQNVPNVDYGPVTVLSEQPDGTILVGTPGNVVQVNANSSPDPTSPGNPPSPVPVAPIMPPVGITAPPIVVVKPPVGVTTPPVGVAPTPVDPTTPPTMNPNPVTALPAPTASPSQTVVQQPDGKTLVAGVVDGDYEVVRYNGNGTLDTSFGTDGVMSFGNFQLQNVQQIKLQSDGSFYVIGESTDMRDDVDGHDRFGGPPPLITTLIHVEADGSIDSSYGNGGVLSLDNPICLPIATMQDDGKIVVVGIDLSSLRSPSPLASLNRYNADGTVDGSFQTTALSPGDFVYIEPISVAIDPQGKIVVTGLSDGNLETLQFNSDGTWDTSIGNSGIAAAAPTTSPTSVATSSDSSAAVSSSPSQANVPPVVMAAQVVTLTSPATTIVTNPSAGAPSVSAQQPATPTVSAAASLAASGDDASTAADDALSAELTVSPAAIDLAFALAGG